MTLWWISICDVLEPMRLSSLHVASCALALLSAAAASHLGGCGGAACGIAPRAADARLVGRRRQLALLRGGEAEEEADGGGGALGAEPDADAPPPIKRKVTVVEGETSDASLLELDAETFAALEVEAGGTVTLRGRKQRRTACVVAKDAKLLPGEARLSSVALAKMRASAGDSLAVVADEVPEGERVIILPFESSLDGFDGDAFDEGLRPFLKDNMRPLTVGDILETPCGDGDDAHVVKWKVVESEPEPCAAQFGRRAIRAPRNSGARNSCAAQFGRRAIWPPRNSAPHNSGGAQFGRVLRPARLKRPRPPARAGRASSAPRRSCSSRATRSPTTRRRTT